MIRVCRIISENRIRERQTGGYDLPMNRVKPGWTDEDFKLATEEYRASTLDTLRQNALGAGCAESDIEVSWVTSDECAVIMSAQRGSESTYTDRRRAEYPSIEDINVALWELVVENRPEAAEALQIKRLAIKERIPKT